jgi:mRNA interferase RelE/StbE
LSWSVHLTARAERDLKRLDVEARRRVVATLERYAETEHGDVRKLVDADPPQWRLRVGSWRVLFTFDPAGGALTVLRVLPRGEAYR